MFYDDLPIWGFVGRMTVEPKVDGSKETWYFLNTHVHFEVKYNGDRVIEIQTLENDLKTLDITKDVQINVTFSFSTKWEEETKIPFERRMEKYARYSFLPQHLEIHWFSIINSCVTVLLLTGFLATILMRVLKNDFIK